MFIVIDISCAVVVHVKVKKIVQTAFTKTVQ